MNSPVFMKNRISFTLVIMIAICLVFFVYTLLSAMHRSDQVEESQLRLISDKLQLENRVVFSGIESEVKLEAKKIESGTHILITRDISFLKNLLDVSDKVAAIGVISEDGEEFAIQKRNNLTATYYYHSSADTLADLTVWDTGEKRQVTDSFVGNRMYHPGIFGEHASQAAGNRLLWSTGAYLPGIATRRGLSASVLATDAVSHKKYLVIFFIPFKRMMTNTVKAGYQKGDLFIFCNDSTYFNFDGTNDSASGFDTTTYFVAWKDIPVKKHSDAIQTWQSLNTPRKPAGSDPVQIAKFKSDGVNYYAAFSPVVSGHQDTHYALVVPSASLPTLLRSNSGLLVVIAFILLLVSGIAFAVIYTKNFRKIRLKPLTPDLVQQMIAAGENDMLEFKSTIRTNLHAGKPGKEIELAWLKSVVAFCNTEGGSILIGVKDDGNILGLDADNFQNDDKCLLHVQNLIREHVGLEYLPYVKFSLLDMEGRKILAVQCIPLKRIMLLKSSGKEQFYVRSGPSSIELPMSKVLEYVNDRKKRF